MKYRVYIFYYALQDGSNVLTYYTNGTYYQSSDTTKGWPTISVTSDDMHTDTTSRSSVAFIDSSSDATLGSSTITYYFNDTNWSTNAGQDPYIEMMDTSKTPDDFGNRGSAVDAICRSWILDFMESLNSSSTYTCDIDTDIISDTDTYKDLDDSSSSDDLILGMDTSRYPFAKTYFARMTYKSSSTATPQYRYYRVFHFVYIRSSGKLKVMHCNANIGVGTGTNYSDTYPQIYITSVDESSNASVYNRYQSGTTSSSYFRIKLTYYTKSSASATSDTTNTNTSYYAKLLDKDTYVYKLDTDVTQDDFDDDVIYSYMKGSAQPDSTASSSDSSYYTTDILYKYDDVKQYVSGIDNYPYVKFVLTRRYYPNQTSYSYQYYYLYGIVKRYSSANGQLSYGYLSVNLSTNCKSSSWPTYTLYKEGEAYSGASGVSASNNQDYIKNSSVIYVGREYYATDAATSTSTSNTTLTLAGNDTYAYADTIPYDSDLESELSSTYSMDSSDYKALVNTEEEEKAETDNFNRHFSNTYSVYYGVDESRDNDFSYYIDSSGNYYFTWLYYRNAWYGSSSSSPTVATTQGKFYAYQNPLYGGYQYYASGTALTTSDLNPDEWEYQGYELDQPMQTLNPMVRYVFENNDTGEVRKYVFTLGGGQAKTYFDTTMSNTALTTSEYDLVYRVTFRARTEYASTHMEELLKGYNFKFSVSTVSERMYGDYYS